MYWNGLPSFAIDEKYQEVRNIRQQVPGDQLSAVQDNPIGGKRGQQSKHILLCPRPQGLGVAEERSRPSKAEWAERSGQ